jgi:hypothetical protein
LGTVAKAPHPPLRGTFSPSERGEGKNWAPALLPDCEMALGQEGVDLQCSLIVLLQRARRELVSDFTAGGAHSSFMWVAVVAPCLIDCAET